jgi:hypothetical protein
VDRGSDKVSPRQDGTTPNRSARTSRTRTSRKFGNVNEIWSELGGNVEKSRS